MIREGDRLLVGLSGGKEKFPGGRGPGPTFLGAGIPGGSFIQIFWDDFTPKMREVMENQPLRHVFGGGFIQIFGDCLGK